MFLKTVFLKKVDCTVLYRSINVGCFSCFDLNLHANPECDCVEECSTSPSSEKKAGNCNIYHQGQGCNQL